MPVKIEIERLNLNLQDYWEYLEMYDNDKNSENVVTNSKQLKDKKEGLFNMSVTSLIDLFTLEYMYNLNYNEWNGMESEKMSGFRISWTYTIDLVPERKFFALKENSYSEYIPNNAFNRLILTYMQTSCFTQVFNGG